MSPNFSTELGSCPDCGSILPILGESGVVKCYRCKQKRGKEGVKSLRRRRKVTVYKAKKLAEQKQDPTEENVRRLLLLSGNRLNPTTTEKIVKRTVLKESIPKETKKEEETAFTDADFEKFCSEYTGE